MRQPRLKASAELPVAFYHCVSRVVNRDFVFGPEEKETFSRFMRQYERFCGVQVVAFRVMSNHFHILLGVPQRPDFSDPSQRLSNEELFSRLKALYSKQVLGTLRQHFALLHQAIADAEKLSADGVGVLAQNRAALETLRMSFYARMWDVSTFMKSLKQRYTQWFNATFRAERHRYGPRRKDGDRKIRSLDATEEDALFFLRDLRKNFIG